MPTQRRTLVLFARLAVAVGALEFLFRAVIRANILGISDFAFPYVSTRLWLSGSNPYDPSLFYPAWAAAGGVLDRTAPLAYPISVYPPVALVPMVPFALLDWPGAVHLFLVCSIWLYGAAVFGLLRLGWPQLSRPADLAKEPLALFFLAIALGFAPIHSAFYAQNLVLLASCAAIIAISSVLSGTTSGDAQAMPRQAALAALPIWLAGATVTLSLCLKPTTGFFLLPWLVQERRWRLLAAIFIACATIAAIAFVPLVAHNGTDWLAFYRSNVDRLFTHGGNADVSSANSYNTDRIDLELVFYAITGSRAISSRIALAIYAVLIFLFIRRAGWMPQRSAPMGKDTKSVNGRHTRLLIASGSLALGMLPVYSRVYAGGVLLPLVLWCLLHLRFSSARWLLLLLSDFLVNSSAILRKNFDTSTLAAGPRRLWDATIGGHTCWLLLAIGVLVVYAMYQQSSEQAENQEESRDQSQEPAATA